MEIQNVEAASCVGLSLHEARERAELTIADIAAITKISCHYLVAIERDEFERIPSRIHAFGFTRAFAKAVDLDDGAVCAALRRQMEETAATSCDPVEAEGSRYEHRGPLSALSRMANSFFSL